MERERKHGGRSWAWWLVIGLAVFLVAYPLSLGPVEWFLENRDIPIWLETGLIYFYAPISVALAHLPDSIVDAYARYVSWWAPLLRIA